MKGQGPQMIGSSLWFISGGSEFVVPKCQFLNYVGKWYIILTAFGTVTSVNYTLTINQRKYLQYVKLINDTINYRASCHTVIYNSNLG